jgi:PAS domain S-box-containing protein
MESIVQSMGDGLIATDARGAIVTFNRAAEELLRVKAQRALGAAIGDVLAGTTGTGRRLAEAALTGRASEGVLHVGSSGVPVAITSTPLTDAAGNETGRVVVLRDMSKVQQAERMKSEFLSNVSHELRTPITPIKGYAEILKRKRFSRDKTEQFLDGVLESTERLERIVEILVDFASIEAGRLTPRSRPINVKSLLDQVTARWQARNGGYRFVRKGGRGLPPINADEKLVERALNELLDNAVKFSPNGGSIDVVAATELNGRSSKPRAVRITVRDRGIGIEPDQMPELFQDFRQLDGSETRSYGGLGLGLAYVKRIVEVQGGLVEVESAPGKGSAFSLVLPVADDAGRSTGARRAEPAARRRHVPKANRKRR